MYDSTISVLLNGSIYSFKRKIEAYKLLAIVKRMFKIYLRTTEFKVITMIEFVAKKPIKSKFYA